VDTFISPDIFLGGASNNAPCIVMSLVAQYFYLTQYSCLLVQVSCAANGFAIALTSSSILNA
jgi:hypothetical protein